MIQRTGNIVFSILLILGFSYLIQMATSFEGAGAVGSSELGSGFFPIVISSFVVVCCLINAVKYILKDRALSPKTDKIELDWKQIVRVTVISVLCISSYFVWVQFGFIPMSVFFMFTVSLVLKVRSIWMVLCLLLFGPAIYFIFYNTLHIHL